MGSSGSSCRRQIGRIHAGVRRAVQECRFKAGSVGQGGERPVLRTQAREEEEHPQENRSEIHAMKRITLTGECGGRPLSQLRFRIRTRLAASRDARVFTPESKVTSTPLCWVACQRRAASVHCRCPCSGPPGLSSQSSCRDPMAKTRGPRAASPLHGFERRRRAHRALCHGRIRQQAQKRQAASAGLVAHALWPDSQTRRARRDGSHGAATPAPEGRSHPASGDHSSSSNSRTRSVEIAGKSSGASNTGSH